MNKRTHRQVFEHGKLTTTAPDPTARITPAELRSLEAYHGEGGTPFFRLIRDGVQFNEYVGVLQTAALTVEVLPKADNGAEDKARWQRFLLTMLRAAGLLPAVTGTASLRLRPTSILDVYMELFVAQLRTLVQRGLIRRYRTTEENTTALKGSLRFAQNIRRNLTHAERFYVRHTVYDRDHAHHSLLLQTLALVRRLSPDAGVASAAAALQLAFPECHAVAPTEETFSRLPTDRKTEPYRTAISIARLLLLALHPDVRRGGQEVLALMFDMNVLWEKYVARTLRRALPPGFWVEEQVRNPFWYYGRSGVRRVRPDMVVYREGETCAWAVLDTKWKRPPAGLPDDTDLKQMLVYNLYNGCERSLLVYPQTVDSRVVTGRFAGVGHGTCATHYLPLTQDDRGGMRLEVGTLVHELLSRP